MTNEEKLEAFRMRLEGATLQECADHFGVTRQRMAQILPKIAERGRPRPNYSDIIYPNIAFWMKANRCNYTRLAQLCGVHYQPVRRALIGDAHPNKPLIDKILTVTGMTYEEAFSK